MVSYVLKSLSIIKYRMVSNSYTVNEYFIAGQVFSLSPSYVAHSVRVKSGISDEPDLYHKNGLHSGDYKPGAKCFNFCEILAPLKKSLLSNSNSLSFKEAAESGLTIFCEKQKKLNKT